MVRLIKSCCEILVSQLWLLRKSRLSTEWTGWCGYLRILPLLMLHFIACSFTLLCFQQGYGQGNGAASYGGQSYAGYGQTGEYLDYFLKCSCRCSHTVWWCVNWYFCLPSLKKGLANSPRVTLQEAMGNSSPLRHHHSSQATTPTGNRAPTPRPGKLAYIHH